VRPFRCRSGRIPLRDPPCPVRQVGEGVSPTLDAGASMAGSSNDVQMSLVTLSSSSVLAPARGGASRHRRVPDWQKFTLKFGAGLARARIALAGSVSALAGCLYGLQSTFARRASAAPCLKARTIWSCIGLIK
jgi:hypothetical protein